MNRQSLVAPFAVVAGVVVALSAQGTSSNSDVNQKTIQSIRVKAIGSSTPQKTTLTVSSVKMIAAKCP